MTYMSDMMERARERAWANFGRRITFYLPGMFSCDGASGKYPAISITGPNCRLQCEHCRGTLLSPMIHAADPGLLVEKCLELKRKGNLGVLISGGCDVEGRLPWERFSPALKEVKQKTGLKVSIHGGFVDEATAKSLKDTGIDQVLVDVVGNDETYREIFHLESGVSRLRASLDALRKARLAIVPHIVCGLHYGRLRGESGALDIVAGLEVRLLVIVSLMKIPHTPLWNSVSVGLDQVAELIAEARLKMPETEISLGCARQRGSHSLETMAIDAGVNRMALPSQEAQDRARFYGLEVKYLRTCCSVSTDLEENPW